MTEKTCWTLKYKDVHIYTKTMGKAMSCTLCHDHPPYSVLFYLSHEG